MLLCFACLLDLTACSHAAKLDTSRCAEPIPDLYQRASPAVVLVTAQSINPYRTRNRVTSSLGSGFIIRDDGLILTNSHVVYGKQSLRVTLDDGTVLPARPVGADPIFDVAVIQIVAPGQRALPTVKLGESARLRPGEEVITLGNPLGLEQTVTRGIVSGINRLLPEAPLSLQEPLIQTDAPINPGNSGGPLLNRCGEAIGINSATIPSAQNIGFAIPIDLAKSVLPALLEDGRVIRPWVGFHGQIMDDELQKLLQIPLVPGLIVEAVEPGSPAEKAGIEGGQVELSLGENSVLLGGDIVVKINDGSVTDNDALMRLMRGLKVGTSLKLRLFRKGAYRDVEYVLPERPLLPGDVPSDCDCETADSVQRPVQRRMTGAGQRW
jgi:serine protease Do